MSKKLQPPIQTHEFVLRLENLSEFIKKIETDELWILYMNI